MFGAWVLVLTYEVMNHTKPGRALGNICVCHIQQTESVNSDYITSFALDVDRGARESGGTLPEARLCLPRRTHDWRHHVYWVQLWPDGCIIAQESQTRMVCIGWSVTDKYTDNIP